MASEVPGSEMVSSAGTSLEGSLSCVWNDHPQTLADILRENRLPLIVRMSAEDVVLSESDSPFSLHQPLLLHQEVRMHKLYARNLARQQHKGKQSTFKEVGPYIVIPQEYQGLFRPLPKGDVTPTEIASISSVARVMPTSFYSATRVRGYVAQRQLASGEIIYVKSDIPPGLFNVTTIHEDHVRYVNSRKSEKRKLMLCLKCATFDGKSVLLFPFDLEGTFYVADLKKNAARSTGIEPSSRVFKLPEVLGMVDPGSERIWELVCGEPPIQECQFTGLMRLCYVTKEHTVIGCTLTPSDPKPFELSISPGPLFVTALNTSDQYSDGVMKKCAEFMTSASRKFTRDIKVRRDFNIEKKELREHSSH